MTSHQLTHDGGYNRGLPVLCQRRTRVWWDLEVQEAPLTEGLLSRKLEEEQEFRATCKASQAGGRPAGGLRD